jgi:hypothetical protein
LLSFSLSSLFSLLLSFFFGSSTGVAYVLLSDVRGGAAKREGACEKRSDEGLCVSLSREEVLADEAEADARRETERAANEGSMAGAR